MITKQLITSTLPSSKLLGALGLALVLGLSGCNDKGTKTTYGKENQLPIANAGADLVVYSGDTVTLDGSKSTDPDGRIIRYVWDQDQGETIRFVDNKVSQPQFTAPRLDHDVTLIFTLTVKDNSEETTTDTVQVLVKTQKPVDPNQPNNNANKAPTVDAGQSRQLEGNVLVQLVGSAADSDGTIVKYLWTRVSGPEITLTNADSAQASFTTPVVETLTDIVLSLTVTDDKGASASASVTIQVKPTPKTVAAPTNLTASLVEPDGAILTWDAVEGISKYFICQAQEPIADIEKCDTYQLGKWARVSDATTYQAYTLRLQELTFFRILAVDKYGNRSPASNATFVMPLLTKPTRPLNDTGVINCSNQSNGTCANLTQDFLFQDAYQGRDVYAYDTSDGRAGFSFTKLDVNGMPLPASATQWSCVQDNTTGITWEIKSLKGDKSLHDKSTSFTHAQINFPVNCIDCAVNQLVQQVNKVGYCGFKDWHIPTTQELRSIMDYSQIGAGQVMVDSAYFPDIAATDVYVTSSPAHSTAFQSPTLLQFNYVSERDFLASDPIVSETNLVRLVRSNPTK